MKIEVDKAPFQPVHLTLDTPEELVGVVHALSQTYPERLWGLVKEEFPTLDPEDVWQAVVDELYPQLLAIAEEQIK